MKNIITIITFCISCMSVQAQVAYYNFFRDTVDISGNGNTLSNAGGLETLYEDCRRYMKFDNTNYLRVANPSFNLTTEFSTVFWMRSSDVTADQKLVGQASLSGGNRGFVVGPEAGVIKAEVFSGTTAVLKSNPIMADEWIHVGVTFKENDSLTIYINGVLDTALAGAFTMSNPTMTNGLVLGTAPWDLGKLDYRGELDDLQLYDTKLSATQIANIYNNVGLCPSGSDPIYVDSSAIAGSNNGLTWANAFTDLQEAIDLSCNCPSADIWVAEGTYHPTQDNPASTDNTARDVTFFIDHAVEIYGGFPTGGTAGGEEDFDERDWNNNPTILTGAIPMVTDTAYHVVVMEAEEITSAWRLDGFIIKDGRADGAQHFDQHGGGLYAHGTNGDNNPNIHNCTFSNNTGFWGGGMSLKTVSNNSSLVNTSPVITNCIFSNNIANGDLGQGGGIYAKSMSITSGVNGNTEPKITNSLFYNNTATGANGAEGGGIYFYAGSPAIAESSPRVVNSTFYNNVTTHSSGSDDKGGALYVSTGGGSNVEFVQPNIVNSIFWNNMASDGPTIWKSDSNQGSDQGTIAHSLVSEDSIVGSIDFAGSNLEMTDPLFVDVTMEDFHLMSSSLGINAGDNASISFGTSTDLDGNPRINYSTVDMGAYEAEFCSEITGGIIYVDSAATGNGTGLNWADAMTDLQGAINASKSCTGNQEIWVAKGTYHPTQDNPASFNNTNRDVTFYIDHQVKIFGGFAGNETVLSQRDWNANLTSLTAAIPMTADTAYHVIVMDASEICPDWRIDGFTIKDGRANSIMEFENQHAGALYVRSDDDDAVISPTFANCIFSNNVGFASSGAVFNFITGDNGTIGTSITNCTFSNNKSPSGSGGSYFALLQDGGNITAKIESSIFDNNEAFFSGGAINFSLQGTGSNAPTIINSLFHNNAAQSEGGAIAASASGVSGSGNVAVEMINCTVADNNATGNGGGIHMVGDTDPFKLYNTIFWNNTGADGDDIFTDGVSGSIDSCIISAGPGALAANNLLVANYTTQDPLFNISGTDYSLQQTSPAINGGKNSLVPLSINTDIIGRSRILNSQVDIGAFEVAACGMDVLFVDIDASPGGDGLSWSTAFDNLQDAIDISALCGNVQSIWVAEGYYYPTKIYDANQDGTLDDREKTFYIDHNVKIYGGFDGTETDVSQRDKDNHVTRLDGDFEGPGAIDDQSYHVLYIDSDASGTTIDMTTEIVDIHIIGGRGVGFDTNGEGAGAYVRASGTTASPIFEGCVFTDNISTSTGGAIYNLAINGGVNATSFMNCSFTSNQAEFQGGAVYNFSDGGNSMVTSSFVNCVFFANNAIDGIAVFNDSNNEETNISFVNCTFSGHSNNGAVIYNSNSTSTITNSILWNSGNAEIENNFGSGSSANVNYSIIEGGLPDQTSGSNNLTVDPLFVSSTDLRLQATSPAINGGSNISLPSSILVDIADLDRINCDTIDMGAYEYQVDLEITCSPAISVETDLNMCSTAKANITLVAPTANCSLASVSNNAPTTFSKGPTTVKWFVVDTDGRKDTCEQVVTVVDNQRPTITCPADITVNVDAGSCVATNVSLGTSSTNDNCLGSIISNNAPTNGIYNLDETMVRWIVTDAAGLKDTCFQKVTVVDNEKPVITCPADITITRVAGTCDLSVDIGMATATDNCTGTISITNDAPTDFPVGPTTVTWIATDGAMQMQTCTQIVTVNEVTPSCPALGDSIFVDSSAMGSTTGLTWTDAFTNLQDAINLACDCAMGDTIPEIHVMEGTYYPCKEFDADGSGGSDPREATFYINKNLKIYGGYYSSSSDIFRDWEDHPTILSGDIGVKGDETDNSYHVMYVDGTTSNGIINNRCVLDGLRVEDGRADGSFPNNTGGGMRNDGQGSGNAASPIIANCVFKSNFAQTRGGAIDNVVNGGMSSPTFLNCVFEENKANDRGGAIFNSGQDGFSSPTIIDCFFKNNTGISRGGAIYNSGGTGESSPRITNCVFEGNQSGLGGAIFNFGNGMAGLNGNSSPIISNSTFANNVTNSSSSAAIHTIGIDNGSSDFAHPVINNSIFWNNGAELYNEDAAITTIINSLLEDAVEDGTIVPIAGTVFMGVNIDAYPMFQDSINGDFRLMTGSPAIDAGDSSFVQSVYDITGYTPRIANQVDMGAYERFRCTEDLRFYLPGVFSQDNEDLYTDGNIEISSGIKRQSDMFFSMKEGMTMLKEFEVEAGSELEVTLDGCAP